MARYMALDPLIVNPTAIVKDTWGELTIVPHKVKNNPPYYFRYRSVDAHPRITTLKNPDLKIAIKNVKMQLLEERVREQLAVQSRDSYSFEPKTFVSPNINISPSKEEPRAFDTRDDNYDIYEWE